ncbi:MAG: hypothetical protein A3K65_00310 [Euryarchaeota archaeon RBG_16_68_12]|nr:MAG: hypothetical protein A3K65_00310 [Euryarchaeota archaeon RBG_16_68_12]
MIRSFETGWSWTPSSRRRPSTIRRRYCSFASFPASSRSSRDSTRISFKTSSSSSSSSSSFGSITS